MIVKLRILHGTLQKKKGGSLGFDVKIRGPRFVMGTADDCSMVCRSSSVSEHHCEIIVNSSEAIVRDLGSENGTFINNEPVGEGRELTTGDFLRLGRMEFEALVEEHTEEAAAAAKARKANPESEKISDELIQADDEARKHRLEDPESLYFDLEHAVSAAAEAKTRHDEEEAARELEEAKQQKKRPKKKKPGKLPERPKYTADNTEQAAEETLRKMFG